VTSVKNVISLHYPVPGKVLVDGSPVSPQHWQLYRRQIGAVMNEGTANLDEPAEEAIADILSEMTITRTVIAHRPALMKRHNVDRSAKAIAVTNEAAM